MSVLLIDNYDSFVFNLARSVREAGFDTLVRRNDTVSLDEIASMAPKAIIISPGPCGPVDAGISVPIVRGFSGRIPILGVCLGHQAIGHAFGLGVHPSGAPVYGHPADILHDGSGLFSGLANPFTAARYHALVVEEPAPGHPLRVTARTSDGLVMALAHESHPTFGVQFHPESILTGVGDAILARFFRLALREDG